MQAGAETPEREQSPDPALTDEAVDQTRKERRVALGCWRPWWQLTDHQLVEGGLEKAAGGSALDRPRECLVLAGG